jgi:hypothetical protein
MTTATVKIGKLTLQLSPLRGHDLRLAGVTARRLAAPGSDFFEVLGEATGLIFIAAKENHPGLSLADVDEGTPQEIVSAVLKLSELTLEHQCGGARRI